MYEYSFTTSRPGDSLRAGEPLGDRGAIGDFLGKDLVGRAAALQQVGCVADDANAHHVVRERDMPEPALVGLRAQDERHHAVVDHFAPCAAKVAPDGRLAHVGARLASRGPTREHALLAGRIDDDLAADHAIGAVAVGAVALAVVHQAHAHRLIAFEHCIADPHTAKHFDAFLRGMIEQQLIEMRPFHMPRAPHSRGS